MFRPMNPKSKLCDPDHWRRRAEATRTKGAALEDGKARARLFKIAEEYDKLARRAQELRTCMNDSEQDHTPEF
ncbi:hypothetical protein BCCGELA001_28880 [Bradyrhizobium sp. CCGE-LA001]|nr:hypothetical protein BCCGELA001_28880 [Bradyrhizobium sp. CCGE-LA001]